MFNRGSKFRNLTCRKSLGIIRKSPAFDAGIENEVIDDQVQPFGFLLTCDCEVHRPIQEPENDVIFDLPLEQANSSAPKPLIEDVKPDKISLVFGKINQDIKTEMKPPKKLTPKNKNKHLNETELSMLKFEAHIKNRQSQLQVNKTARLKLESEIQVKKTELRQIISSESSRLIQQEIQQMTQKRTKMFKKEKALERKILVDITIKQNKEEELKKIRKENERIENNILKLMEEYGLGKRTLTEELIEQDEELIKEPANVESNRQILRETKSMISGGNSNGIKRPASNNESDDDHKTKRPKLAF